MSECDLCFLLLCLEESFERVEEKRGKEKERERPAAGFKEFGRMGDCSHPKISYFDGVGVIQEQVFGFQISMAGKTVKR